MPILRNSSVGVSVTRPNGDIDANSPLAVQQMEEDEVSLALDANTSRNRRRFLICRNPAVSDSVLQNSTEEGSLLTSILSGDSDEFGGTVGRFDSPLTASPMKVSLKMKYKGI